jgi:hypothetical protein
MQCRVGLDLVVQDQPGAGVVAAGVVELVAEGGESLGPAWGGEWGRGGRVAHRRRG